MSDTSTLIAIKYKGQMINLPGDSSVSWDDLTDKPVVIKQGGTQTVTHYYDIVSYQPIKQLKQSGYGYGDSYRGYALYVNKQSITNAINALSSQLSDDQKNIWRIEWTENGDDEWEIEAVIDIDNEEVLYFSGDHGITLNNVNLDYNQNYWIISVSDPNMLLDEDIPVSVDIIPVNFITSDNQTVTSLSYTETIVVPEQWYFDPDHIEKDASVGILWDTSMNGGSADLSDYYTKTQIDTSIANNYASKNDISALDTSVSQLWDSSTSGGGVDTSNFVTKTELYDIETTTTEPGYAKGDSMYVGKGGQDSTNQIFLIDPQTNKAYFVFNNLTEQDDIWSYSYYGDYCYMEIININDNNSVYGWFILYKEGTVVMTSENLSANQISLEYRTSTWPVGLMIIVDDSNMNPNPYSYRVDFYQCTYTGGETITTYTIKESLLPNISGGGVSIQYLTQAEYDALQTKDPNTLYLIEESV